MGSWVHGFMRPCGVWIGPRDEAPAPAGTARNEWKASRSSADPGTRLDGLVDGHHDHVSLVGTRLSTVRGLV